MSLSPIINTKLFPLLKAVSEESVRDARLFHFDKRNSQQLAVICVYCSILELLHCEIVLFEKGQTTGLPIVLRSILETYADLCALIKDKEYHKNMYASFLEEKLRFLNNVSKFPSNPFLQGISKGMDVNNEKSNLEQEIASLKSEGRKSLKHSDRFESAGLENEYQSVYWLLCLESHNNMSALDNRHIEKESDDYHAALFKPADLEDMARILDTLLALTIDSSNKIHKFFQTEAMTTYESHKKTLDEVRRSYPIT